MKVRDALVNEFAGFERKLRAIARQDENAQRLMTTPSVGVLVALTFVAAVDAPERFRSSRAVGPHFGLTQRPLQKDRIMYRLEQRFARGAPARCRRRCRKRRQRTYPSRRP
nr:transposase [Sinorhizobium meliloti]